MTPAALWRDRMVLVAVASLVAILVVVLDGGSRSGPKAPAPGRHLGNAAESLPSPAPAAPLADNLYRAAGPGMLSPAVADARALAYVPDSDGSAVDVIDPATFRVVDRYRVGRNPQHVVPSWDLRTLYVANDLSNTLTPLDPKTGKPGGPAIAVDDPYNLYFTPDGAAAIVVAEARQDLDFRDPHSFVLRHRLHVDCRGVDHLDFSGDGTFLIASCEFSGQLVKVDLRTQAVVGYLNIGGKPQDVRVDPAGAVFYVADMDAGGVHEIDGAAFGRIGFLATGPETHGLYPSRDARFLYISNRGGRRALGSVSVLDFASRQLVATWPIPGGGTPDMGGVSADGRQLWLSGRRSRAVYVLDTGTGALVARIPVGSGPHGLCLWPQPGRYSLGHTGNMR